MADNSSTPLLEGDDSICCKSLSKKILSILLIILVVLCTALIIALIVVIVNRDSIFHHGSHGHGRVTDGFLFFQVSDTHLDLHYNEQVNTKGQMCRNISRKDGTTFNISQTVAPFGRPGCDSPKKLVVAAAEHMKKINKENGNKAQFILFTGDQFAHSYDNFNVNKSILMLESIGESAKIFTETLQIPFIPTLGNNDIPEDYEAPLHEHSKFYKQLGTVFAQHIFLEGSTVASLNSISSFQTDFGYYGYYALNLTDDMMTIVVNTNYWDVRSININSKYKVVGEEQMTWFTNQLDSAKKANKKVIIVGHIPPGISAYKNEGSFWVDEFTNNYIKAVMKYHDIILGQFYAHIHQDKIQVQSFNEKFQGKILPEETAYVMLCPSITPIYSSNAAFRLLTLDPKTKSFLDYAQYYMDLLMSNVYNTPIWNLEYKFSELYGSMLSVEAIVNIADKIVAEQDSTWIPYSIHMRNLFSGASSTTRAKEHCAARYSQSTSFTECMEYYTARGA